MRFSFTWYGCGVKSHAGSLGSSCSTVLAAAAMADWPLFAMSGTQVTTLFGFCWVLCSTTWQIIWDKQNWKRLSYFVSLRPSCYVCSATKRKSFDSICQIQLSIASPCRSNCESLVGPHSHRMRSTLQHAHTNYGTHCSQWECSHRLQATSKGLHANLHANVLTRPVWMGPSKNLLRSEQSWILYMAFVVTQPSAHLRLVAKFAKTPAKSAKNQNSDPCHWTMIQCLRKGRDWLPSTAKTRKAHKLHRRTNLPFFNFCSWIDALVMTCFFIFLQMSFQ